MEIESDSDSSDSNESSNQSESASDEQGLQEEPDDSEDDVVGPKATQAKCEPTKVSVKVEKHVQSDHGEEDGGED